MTTTLMRATRSLNEALEQATRGRLSLSHVLVGVAVFLLSGVYGAALAEGFSALYLMLIPVGLVSLWLVFTIPEYAALALCGLRWGFIFDAFDRTLRIQSPAMPLAVLLLLVVLVRCFGPRRQRFVLDPIALLLVLYFGWVCMGMWYAQFPQPVEARIVEFAKDVVVALVIMLLITSPVVFQRTMWLIMGIGALFGTLSVYQELTQTYDNSYWGLARMRVAIIVEGLADRPRAAGPLGDPNFYGQLLLMVLPLAFGFIFNARTLAGRLVGGYTVLVVLSAIGLTYSRGTLVALILVAALVFYFYALDVRYLALIGALVIAVVMLAPPELKARFSTLGSLTDEGASAAMTDNSFQRRWVEVAMAWYMFLDHPLIGIGADNYRPYYPLYIREFGAPVEDVERNAHSYYLEVAAEHGLIGLSLVVGMIVLSVRRIRQAQRDFRAIGNHYWANMATSFLISFYGYLATAIILHGDFPRMLWIYIALAVAIGLAGRNAHAAQEAREVAAAPPALGTPQPALTTA